MTRTIVISVPRPRPAPLLVIKENLVSTRYSRTVHFVRQVLYQASKLARARIVLCPLSRVSLPVALRWVAVRLGQMQRCSRDSPPCMRLATCLKGTSQSRRQEEQQRRNSRQLHILSHYTLQNVTRMGFRPLCQLENVGESVVLVDCPPLLPSRGYKLPRRLHGILTGNPAPALAS